VSLGIVAFGQPSFSPLLGVVASAGGYALFWRFLISYPLVKQRFFLACFWYSLVSLIQLSWMASTQYQGLYILAVLALLVLWLGLQFGLLSLLLPYNRFPSLIRLFAIAGLWTLMEWSRFYIFCGYSWNLAGMALSQGSAIQMAALFGVLGLSFWVMLVNLVALRAFFRKNRSHYFSWAALAVFPYLFGWGYTLYQSQQETNGKSLCCALVQTGLFPDEKMPMEGKESACLSGYEQWKRILQILQSAPEKQLDLIVLPEAVVPYASTQCVYSQEEVKRVFITVFGEKVLSAFPPSSNALVSNAFWTQTLANFLGGEVIIGMDHQESSGKSYSSAFSFLPGGGRPSRYDKHILLPLVEYLPFEWLRSLSRQYGIVSFYSPGKHDRPFPGKVRVAPSICYEETFPSRVRAGRKKGAELLLNLTNDGWFPFSRLPSQHLEHARLRAVENGACLLRACNTGITTAIDRFGKEIARLQETEENGRPYTGVLVTSVKADAHVTPYLVWGDGAIVGLCFLFFGLFLLGKTLLYVLSRFGAKVLFWRGDIR
jgi:apolipoprotein N-acyltransferase